MGNSNFTNGNNDNNIIPVNLETQIEQPEKPKHPILKGVAILGTTFLVGAGLGWMARGNQTDEDDDED